MKRVIPLVVILASLLIGGLVARADIEYNLGSSMSGDGFRILDAQHGGFGGTSSSSSTNFRLLGTIGDLAIGSSSATTFGLRSGFLYFPFIQQSTLTTATCGNQQVTLAWTDTETDAGLVVGGYNVCRRIGLGPYTCVDAGDVNAFVQTGLTNGTAYTFRIQGYDFYENPISESNTLNATPCPPGGGGGGGGGGGTLPPSSAIVIFEGIAYPGATVHVMRNGIELGTTTADINGRWTFTRSSLPTGSTTFGFWATDLQGRRSTTYAFTANVVAGTNRFTGIIIPPTIELSTTQVQAGQPVTVRGSSAPGATVRIDIDVPGGRQLTVVAAIDGTYSAVINTTGLPVRIYNVRARTEFPPGADMSIWSQSLQFGVGVPPPVAACPRNPDVNRDGRVDLVDFSVMAFWWRKPTPPPEVDLNCDGELTLADFSILAFHWTGR